MVVSAEVPELVLLDRAADVGVAFPELDVRLAGVAASRLRRVPGLVVADEGFLLVREVVQHLHGVAAALDSVDHRRTRRVHLDVAAGGGNRDFVVGEEIGVEAGAAGALGRIHAVVQHAVLVTDAKALVAGLLTLVAAADVEAVHADARCLAEHRPHVGGRGNANELVGREVGADFRVLHVDDRRYRRHRDRLLQRGHTKLRVDGQNLAETELEVAALEGLEAGQLERQFVFAGRKRCDRILAVSLGDNRPDADERRRFRRDRHARQHRALRVARRASESALIDLRHGRRRERNQRRGHDGHTPTTFHERPPRSQRPVSNPQDPLCAISGH